MSVAEPVGERLGEMVSVDVAERAPDSVTVAVRDTAAEAVCQPVAVSDGVAEEVAVGP